MTTGWKPMTNLRDGFPFGKKSPKRVQGIIRYKPHGSMFLLATIIFVFDIPRNAPSFVKTCNRRQDSQTWDPQAPLMADQVDKRVVQAIRDGPKSTTSLSACCDRDSDTDERAKRERRKQSQRSAKSQKWTRERCHNALTTPVPRIPQLVRARTMMPWRRIMKTRRPSAKNRRQPQGRRKIRRHLSKRPRTECKRMWTQTSKIMSRE